MSLDMPTDTLTVLASRVRWEEKEILGALESRGVAYEIVDPRTMAVPMNGRRFAGPVVLNREISHTRALYAALALERMGARVVNSARSIEICGDKWRTASLLTAAGLPIPETVLALTPEAARDATEKLGYPLVIKPLTGSWGRRVALVRDPDAADAVLEYCAALPTARSRVVCLQELVRKPGRDIRVIVVDGEPLGAIYRRARNGWKTNISNGGEALRCPLGDEVARLAVEATRAVGAQVAGVDLVERPDGDLCVLEVNGVVEFRGFAGATGVDVASAVVGSALRAGR